VSVKELPALTNADVIKTLLQTVTALMIQRPEFERSKLIMIPDPRDETQLLPVHTGPRGTAILTKEELQLIKDELLCEQCQSEVRAYSVIHTGLNLPTGAFDEDCFIGLEGGHMNDDPMDEIGDGDEPLQPVVDPNDLSNKRTLN
jgi:hypothetical protein